MKTMLAAAVALATFFGLTARAASHEFDHFTPLSVAPTVPGTTALSGPVGAWQFIATIPTGNPHTDIDFFTQRGEIYASVGTLAAGGNDAGQTIVKLTQSGNVTPTSPQFVSGHGSADCIADPSQATGLQHDVEATPKGHAILNTEFPFSVRKDAQLLVDATDNPGRCHDNGAAFGFVNVPQGGLELIDITSISAPVEIGLTSHIGESHTVNVDPKRPHIAYSVTSDFVGVTCNADDTSCTRANENPSSSQRFNLDGFEVVDMSSCMNFRVGTTLAEKRARCRPQVYRYRWSSALIALGHSVDSLAACHELEIYPDDKLTCAGVNATLYFDIRGAFDSNGKPKGTPLPCRVRASTSTVTGTGAMVTDCVTGQNNQDLTIPGWLAIGAPSLTGVKFLGAAFHQGRVGNTPPPYDATQDVEISHEAELSASRRLILATDERGGGVLPPGAACVTSPGDNTIGNGGIHAFRVSKLQNTTPSGVDPKDASNNPTGNPAAASTASQAYALTPSGGKAIYRAQIRTQPQVDLCTSHVFHQIPGQNRIFMAWYSQGTQVVDFVEHPNGRVEFIERGFFIPTQANEWVSAVFKVKRNSNGTYTYWGATGDFGLGTAGRSAIDIYKVTLPAPPRPLGQGGDDGMPPGCEDGDDDDHLDLAMAGPLSASAGSTIRYDLTYTNLHASDDAECAEVDLDLDDDAEFVSASSGGVYDPATHTVSWSLGRLAPGVTGTVSADVRVSPTMALGSMLVSVGSLSEPGMLPVAAPAMTTLLP